MDKLRDTEEMYGEMKGKKIGKPIYRKLLNRLRLEPWPCPECGWDKVRSGANYRTLDPKVGTTGSQPDIIVFDLQDAQLGKINGGDLAHILVKGAVACTIKRNQANNNALDIALSIDPGSDLSGAGGDPSTPPERANALERFARENIHSYLGLYNPYTNVNTSTAQLNFSVTSKQDIITVQDADFLGADITSAGQTYGYRTLTLLVNWESPH